MFKCESTGCKFTADSRRGLGIHWRHCKFRDATILAAFEKRKAREEADASAAEIRRKARLEELKKQEEALARPPSPPPPPPSPPVPPPTERAPSSRASCTTRIPSRYADFVPSNRSKRSLPSRLAMAFPEPPRAPTPPPPPPPPSEPTPEPEEDEYEDVWETDPDAFGIFRKYVGRLPMRDPMAGSSLDAVCDAPGLGDSPCEADPNCEVNTSRGVSWLARSLAQHANVDLDSFAPFENCSQFRLVDHYYIRDTHSRNDFDDLLAILRSDGFDLQHLKGFSARRAEQMLDEYSPELGIFSADDGWLTSPVTIPLPKARSQSTTEAAAPHFTVQGVIHRHLMDLIKGLVTDTNSRFTHNYHWVGHEMYWVPPHPQSCSSSSPSPSPSSSPSSPSLGPTFPTVSACPADTSQTSPPSPIRVYTDCYNSNAMLAEEAKLRKQARNPDDNPLVEYVVLPLLIWSDATQLSSFGSAKLWPIYVYLGNLSKYVRGRPTEFAGQHLAYIPDLSDVVQDFYMDEFKVPPTAEVLKFCRKELFQQIWKLILDVDVMHAYEHGVLLQCGDGVTRRIFPRFFTYSADYPEKVIATGIKQLARCPCPRCLTRLDQIAEAGTKRDSARRARKREDTRELRERILRAREFVFKGRALTSEYVRNSLDSESLNPIQTAFSERLAQFGVNFYEMFAPDLMHEFELGVWKGVFNHLMRLLVAQGSHKVEQFNKRMRQMPTFGRDRIRRFWHDVATRKRLAARDYEAFLITIIPAYEGLLPLRDDQTVTNLLFELANWHVLAKLRLHTQVTVDVFRAATTHMYAAVREFARTTCMRYATLELPKEMDARVRREVARGSDKQPDGHRRPVAFNVINTFKYHSLGDYPDYIERSGTTDNYSTQVGELEHRHAKRFYARTNRVAFTMQIARKQRHATVLKGIRQRDTDFQPKSEARREQTLARKEAAEAIERCVRVATDRRQGDSQAPTPPIIHYEVSQTQRAPIRLRNWAADHRSDPALDGFMPLLRDHLLRRILGLPEDDEFTPEQHDGLEILDDKFYRHKVMRVNYTTYDMRRDQDSVNPRTHPDIMLLASTANADLHPYWYARVIEIFHLNVGYWGPGSTRTTKTWQRFDVLWVRWFELDLARKSGFQYQRLPRVRFVAADDPEASAFGFVDPEDVVRACYLMPAFNSGRTNGLLGPSRLARKSAPTNTDDDWAAYDVCMWVDRDMFMRYLDGGVGHRGTGVSLDISKQHAFHRIRRRSASSFQNTTQDDARGGSESSEDDDGISMAAGDESGEEWEELIEENEPQQEDGAADGEQAYEDGEGEEGEEEDEEDVVDGEATADADEDGDEDALEDTVYAAEGFAPL